MCKPKTRGQWLSTREATFSPELQALAQSVYKGQDKDAYLRQLHDALLNAGHVDLAAHFADPKEKHSGKYASWKGCWALLLLMDKLPPERELIGTSTASEWLGIQPTQFRDLAARLGLEPKDWYTNPHYQSSPYCCPLWSPDEINSLANSPEVTAIHQRQRQRQEASERKVQERRRIFARRYLDWHDALPDAAEAMYALECYGKGNWCRPTHREEILRLKSAFLELLYCSGHAKDVQLRWTEKRRLPCHPCCGAACTFCRGTGRFKKWDCRQYLAFRFEVGGRLYTWFQPREHVTWPFLVTGEECWQPEQDAEPVDLAALDTAEAKALVRFVLEAAGALRENAA